MGNPTRRPHHEKKLLERQKKTKQLLVPLWSPPTSGAESAVARSVYERVDEFRHVAHDVVLAPDIEASIVQA